MLTDISKIEGYSLITIDPEFYPQVDEFISAVTAYIERYTGRTFTTDETATTRTFDGNGSSELFIDDASEITQVKIGNTILQSSDFYLYPSNRLPKTRIFLPYKIFYSGSQNITVTAKWGYGAIPDDLSLAATVMVAGIINSADTNDNEILSETIGRYSVTYRAGTNQSHDFQNAKDVLKMYRRMI